MITIGELLTKKIKSGSYDRDDLMPKLDVFLLKNRISKEKYEELVALMDAKAAAE